MEETEDPGVKFNDAREKMIIVRVISSENAKMTMPDLQLNP